MAVERKTCEGPPTWSGAWPSIFPECRSNTHVARLSRRLGLTAANDPVKIELDLDATVQPKERVALSLRLILHGRRICTARSPRCEACVLKDFCPSAFTFGKPRPKKGAASAGGIPPG